MLHQTTAYEPTIYKLFTPRPSIHQEASDSLGKMEEYREMSRFRRRSIQKIRIFTVQKKCLFRQNPNTFSLILVQWFQLIVFKAKSVHANIGTVQTF